MKHTDIQRAYFHQQVREHNQSNTDIMKAKMIFGKYHGVEIGQLPSGYFEWVLSQFKTQKQLDWFLREMGIN